MNQSRRLYIFNLTSNSAYFSLMVHLKLKMISEFIEILFNSFLMVIYLLIFFSLKLDF